MLPTNTAPRAERAGRQVARLVVVDFAPRLQRLLAHFNFHHRPRRAQHRHRRAFARA